MPKLRIFLSSLIVSLLVISGQVWSDTVTLEANFTSEDTNFVTKLNNDRTALANAVNNIEGAETGSAQSSGQVKADTIAEENMADDANPRIRTNQGAACADLVVTGLQPSTTVGTLVGSISAGTAYPDGYYVNKASATGKTFTASKWTWVFINTSGTFEYEEVAIGGATPTAPANTATLAKVSTDSTQINTVTDLRTTSCASGPFSILKDEATGASLGDIFTYGTSVRDNIAGVTNPDGFVSGLTIKYSDHDTFTVTEGCAYINGEYRCLSSDLSVEQQADNETNGTSGYDSGSSPPASDVLYVYAVADQEDVSTLSISYSTSDANPTGPSNYRLLGWIVTDASGLFLSRDVVTVHQVNEFEVVGAMISFNGSDTTIASGDFAYNISSVTDNATGDYTINFDNDFGNAFPVVLGFAGVYTGPAYDGNLTIKSVTAAGVTVFCADNTNTAKDCQRISVVGMGDK